MEEIWNTRVMLVDSVPLTRIGLRTLINAQPQWHVCAEAGEARVARQLCVEQRPDIIVLDLELRRGDGIELLEDFARLHPGVRALVLSQREDALSFQRAFQAGAHGYVAKGDEAEEVLEGLKWVLAGRCFASRQVAHLLVSQFKSGHLCALEAGIETLSNRELQVFRLIGRGTGATAIARELGVSVKTVETHRRRMKGKLRLSTAVELNGQANRWVSTTDFAGGPRAPHEP